MNNFAPALYAYADGMITILEDGISRVTEAAAEEARRRADALADATDAVVAATGARGSRGTAAFSTPGNASRLGNASAVYPAS